jgi:hypothetical protein
MLTYLANGGHGGRCRGRLRGHVEAFRVLGVPEFQEKRLRDLGHEPASSILGKEISCLLQVHVQQDAKHAGGHVGVRNIVRFPRQRGKVPVAVHSVKLSEAMEKLGPKHFLTHARALQRSSEELVNRGPVPSRPFPALALD